MIGRLKTEGDLRRFIESELRRPGARPPAPVDERVGLEPFTFSGGTGTALLEVEHGLGVEPTWVGLTVLRNEAGTSTFGARLVDYDETHIKFQVNCSIETSVGGSVLWRVRGGIA